LTQIAQFVNKLQVIPLTEGIICYNSWGYFSQGEW